jgi:hypothetical protein
LLIQRSQDIINQMRLFHFSSDPGIEKFVPRRPTIAASRPQGKEWLNNPLVWAIDVEHEFTYLFPRECPRILIWRAPDTIEQDCVELLQGHRAVAFVEMSWLDQIRDCTIYRYEMPADTFESLMDAGMWVSRSPVIPNACSTINNFQAELASRSVKLIFLETLTPLKSLWDTSLHVSGIRLRNALMWEKTF